MEEAVTTVDGNVDELSASELLRSVEATNSLPFVTMRKHKKSNKDHNRADVAGHSTNVSSGADVLVGADVPGATQVTNENVGNADVTGPTYHDFILGVFGISLKSISDIDLFVKELEAGKSPVWPTLDNQTQLHVKEAVVGLGKAFVLDMQANAMNSDFNGTDSTPNINMDVPAQSPSVVEAPWGVLGMFRDLF
ncbi:hypothetical protein CTI12_AA261250 [Artemisia annua]|uniref:Uncharacterized protein n=1 Tax=Artemisia annua TaxID=35608 RepID=A0A2U1NIU1_ARTAN|nr:hypothetical protein CTI12_AA261250 [Artemisia annua]